MRTPARRRVQAAEDLRSTNPGKKGVGLQEDEDLRNTKRKLRKDQPGHKIEDIIPDPETDKGRAKLVHKLETEAGNLRHRSQLIKRKIQESVPDTVIEQAAKLEKTLKEIEHASSREDLRDKLADATTQFVQLKKVFKEFEAHFDDAVLQIDKFKNLDAVGFVKELVQVLTAYEETRGRVLDPKVIDYLKAARVARVYARRASTKR